MAWQLIVNVAGFGLATAITAWLLDHIAMQKLLKSRLIAYLAAIVVAALLVPTLWLLSILAWGPRHLKDPDTMVEEWSARALASFVLGTLFSAPKLYRRWRENSPKSFHDIFN